MIIAFAGITVLTHLQNSNALHILLRANMIGIDVNASNKARRTAMELVAAFESISVDFYLRFKTVMTMK